MKATFDLDAQPGITTRPITRSMVIDAVKALGLDARDVLNLTVGSNDVTVTALLRTTDGARVLGHRGPHGGDNGYLKHTYTVRIVDDEEAMTPSEYYAREA